MLLKTYTFFFLLGLGYVHRTVNHSLHFVDPATGVHTNHAESLWNEIKRPFKAMKGLRRTSLPSHLDEFMWRKKRAKNCVLPDILQARRTQYPLH